MPDIAAIIQSGMGNAWLMLPTALMLGALHALEPGHSKSMMMAFIVATNGTARQAALLAVAATVGHTIVVWILALLAWRLGDAGLLARAEPWLMLIGGLLIVALALRILLRLGRTSGHAAHSHDHGHHGHGGHDLPHQHPHDHAHPHVHAHSATSPRTEVGEDAHAAAHAAEIKRRFTGGPVTNAEIAWFGFTGGLLPCPAAFAVLLACLQQQAYVLGLVMVATFSIGLALMLVAIGVAAALGAGALKSRFSTIERVTQLAPYVSAGIVLVIGILVVVEGAKALLR